MLMGLLDIIFNDEKKSGLTRKDKAINFVKAIGTFLICSVIVALLFKPAFYIVSQFIRFVIYSLIWLFDLIWNNGRNLAEANPFKHLVEWNFFAFLF